jgi:putative phage-type endonuclease
MSYGNISTLLEKTKTFVETKNINNMDANELQILKNKVHKHLKKEDENVQLVIIDEIFNRLFSRNYNYNNMLQFSNGMNSFREIRELYPSIIIPKEYISLQKHFDTLLATPQPAQRTKEWYDYRYNRITASDTAAAIDLNPYEPVESFILKKCDPNFPFRDNATVFHGRKYEPTATMIYEHMTYSDKKNPDCPHLNKESCEVTEFGCMKANKKVYEILGASPDGICSIHTLDNKFSKRLGVMLEIKCPVTREIHNSGVIAGDVCPFYYYCQVQQQLTVCELNICDFWQCKLSEYTSREEYLADKCETCENTVGYYKEDPKNTYFGSNVSTAVKIDMDNRLKKGIILEFFPKNFKPEFEGDNIEWKSKYIYPKRLDMDEAQYDDWVLKMLHNYSKEYPELYKDYNFNKIIYWKLDSSHNISIKQDDKFMMSILPILTDTWSKIVYYRKNQDKLDELKKIVDERKKYLKINTSYTIHNDNIIKSKLLFLDPKFNPTESGLKLKAVNKYNFKKAPKKEEDSDYDDFGNDNECDFIDDNVSIQLPISKATNIKKTTKTIKHTEYKKTVEPKETVPSKPLKLKYTNVMTVPAKNEDDCEFID